MHLNYPGDFEWPDLVKRLASWGGYGDPLREAEAQAIVDSYTVAEAKAWLRGQVADRARMVQDAFLSAQNYSAGEASSWPIKRAEAVAFKASGNPADAPVLSIEAATSGRTLDSVATRVLNNAVAFQAFSATCAGNRARHQDAINALTSFSEVASYDYSTGWPA